MKKINEKDYLNKEDKSTQYFIHRKYLFLDRWLPFGKCKVALDIGSGWGLMSELLLDKSYEVFAIDKDLSLLKNLPKKVNGLLMDAEKKLLFGTDSMDIILLLAVLEHIDNKQQLLKEINRILKPEGKIIMSLPNTDSYFYKRLYFTYWIRGGKPWENIHFQKTYDEWKKLISKHLEIVEEYPILSVPFFEPKLIKQDTLSDFEYKSNRANKSAEVIFVCKKKKME